MKKLLFLALGLAIIVACQKGDNALIIDPDSPLGTGDGGLPQVASIDPAYGGQLFDESSNQTGIQGQITVVFDNYMDPATITAANVSILNVRTNDEIDPADMSVEYFQEIRTMYIWLDLVPDSGMFLIQLTSGGMRNTYGSPLDFDGDDVADGSPYDDFHSVFYTAPIVVDTPMVLVQPMITGFTPDTIATSATQPLIQLDFNLPMDTSTLNNSTITLTDEGGDERSLNVVAKTLTSITLQPASALADEENYTITVACDDIRMHRGLTDARTPEYFLKLDGDEDGPEQNEPDLTSYFRVDDPNAPPHLTSVVDIGSSGATITFSRLLEDATVNRDNIKIYDAVGYVPGDLRIYTNTAGDRTIVDYYYLRTVGSGLHAYLLIGLQGTNGYYFDGNGNGIGGEPWDNLDTSF